SLSDSRQRLAVEPDECSTESPCAGEACAFSDEADRKAGVVEQALGTAHTKRKRHLQRRRVEMFGKKSRQVTRADPEPIGKLVDVTLVECASLDQGQCTLDRCPCALPGRTERRCF